MKSNLVWLKRIIYILLTVNKQSPAVFTAAFRFAQAEPVQAVNNILEGAIENSSKPIKLLTFKD